MLILWDPQKTDDAVKFYTVKIDALTSNLTDLEKIIAQKGQNVKIVEEGMVSSVSSIPTGGKSQDANSKIVLRQKVMAQSASASA